MAVLQINTQSTQHQTRLTQLDQIIDFYRPIVSAYLSLRSEEQREQWRQRDPILRRFVRIYEAMSKRDAL